MYYQLRFLSVSEPLHSCERRVRITAGKKLMIFEKVWITETREEVYIAELICQVSKVYDYPRQMRGNPIKSAITVG